MRFFNWGLFRKISFFITGSGVATNLAMTQASTTAATTSNLVAVAGGSAYSIFKNLETATNIANKGKDCHDILQDMRDLVDSNDTQDLLEKLGILEEEAQNMLKRINVVEANGRRGYVYAGINVAVQIILGAFSIGLNAGSVAQTGKDDNNLWSTTSSMNMFITPLLVFSQYIIHSLLIARPLRKMDDQNTELKNIFSAQARVFELDRIVKGIDGYYQTLIELNESIGPDEIRLDNIDSEIKVLRLQTADAGVEEEFEKKIKERIEVEQKIEIQNEEKKQISKLSQDLVNDANKLIIELRISFAPYRSFEDISSHVEEIMPRLEEIRNPSSSLSMGVS